MSGYGYAKEVAMLRKLVCVCIGAMWLVGAVRADITDGLVGLWLFDEGKGNEALDSSGAKNTATLDAAAKWTAGKWGQALLASPQNGAVVPISDSLNSVVDGLSIGGWFRIDKDSDTGLRRDSGYLLEDQSATEQNPDGWAFGVWSGGGITLVWGQKKIKQGEWTHIAGTFDGSVLSLYVNGELDSTANLKGKVDRPATTLGLGKYGGETYIGGVDEAFLYKRGITKTELAAVIKGYTATAVQARDKAATRWGELKSVR